MPIWRPQQRNIVHLTPPLPPGLVKCITVGTRFRSLNLGQFYTTVVENLPDMNSRGIFEIRLAKSDILVWWWFTLRSRVLWWRTLSRDVKMTWLLTWRYFFEGEFSGGQVSWEFLKPSDKKLGLRRTPTWIKCFFSLEESEPLDWKPAMFKTYWGGWFFLFHFDALLLGCRGKLEVRVWEICV